ncbi:hypothetical protein [Bifidobacterium crudilactis]|uniref:hypothetical protein n=1 Tax=Bifidobacterium crudilactis TaxID=327277 RepID=UPI002357F5EA|nr:hypothetical protein [Bifidobacterium crudilactis]
MCVSSGSVWASNPYEYAANNPLMFSDPLGLKSLTDEQLQKHNDADNWFEGDGAWVIGGLMLVGGAACIATGFGGPLGMALIMGGCGFTHAKSDDRNR